MSVLIADSGATKTDWIIGGRPDSVITTGGLNPHIISENQIAKILQNELAPKLRRELITEIEFYGAGCGLSQKKAIVKKNISQVFPDAEVFVGTDLEAAAQALFPAKRGVVCILGTGSSAGLYENGNVVRQMKSVGYPDGDEGSASYIGQKIVRAYKEGRLPDGVKRALEKQESLKVECMMQHSQNSPIDKTRIAQIAGVLADNSHPFMQNILEDGFSEFARKIKNSFSSEDLSHIGISGTVGYNHQQLINKVFGEHNLPAPNYILKPIFALADLP